MSNMKAKLLLRERYILAENAFVEMVVWQCQGGTQRCTHIFGRWNFTEDGHPVLYTLAGIICTPLGILIHSSTKQHIRESEEKLAAREQEITDKKAELKRHRKVVKA